MNNFSRIPYLQLFIIINLIASLSFIHAQDWPELSRYSEINKQLDLTSKNQNRIVFMGNSITEGWSKIFPEFFEGKPYINRGISGQTTPQMLIRFRPDVIDLGPKVVLILAGINDIAGNTGPATVKMISDNIISMAELANANKIKVIMIHGNKDEVVPINYSKKVLKIFKNADKMLLVIKNGDHILSSKKKLKKNSKGIR